jgi:hypothetical protein
LVIYQIPAFFINLLLIHIFPHHPLYHIYKDPVSWLNYKSQSCCPKDKVISNINMNILDMGLKINI